ncbi:cupin domain-containing protein [bacterium]|nr:cupin domain-containing protein [bacterium]
MKIAHYTEIPELDVESQGAKGVKIRWLISETDNAPNFAMRMFTVEPGGNTPLHKHSWEHEAYILEGEGTVVIKGAENAVREGFAILVPPDVEHQFKNKSNQLLRFLCLVPFEKN